MEEGTKSGVRMEISNMERSKVGTKKKSILPNYSSGTEALYELPN